MKDFIFITNMLLTRDNIFDPFYGEGSMISLKKSIKEANEGKLAVYELMDYNEKVIDE